MFKSVLVVCTGNICRSPVGERALAALCPHLTVTSAGIGALVGKGVDKNAAAVARAHNVNVEGHAARQITPEILAMHDLVLVMGPEHRQYIRENFPQASGKTMMFDKWERDEGIEDPYLQSVEFHELVFSEIDKSARSWARRLG
jgi:protein-tyrosine phosphatase